MLGQVPKFLGGGISYLRENANEGGGEFCSRNRMEYVAYPHSNV